MNNLSLAVHFFAQLAVILLVCRAVGLVAKRFGQPQVVAEMIAGVMLGPSLLGAVLPEAQAILFPKATLDMLYVGGQVGVGMYMFLVGTEFQAAHIRSRYRSAMAVSWAGIAVPFVLAFALAPWLQRVPGLFADNARFLEVALFLGAAIAITAFPMLARIIQERGLAGTPLGTLALTAGAMDDAAAWCILAIVLASFGGSWEQARLSGESPRDAKAIGALMNARGLMELIIINIGLQAGLIKPGLFTILVIMAILTTLVATPLFNRIMRDSPAPALPATDGPPA